MNKETIFKAYICEALRRYRLDCIDNKEKADEEIIEMFRKLLKDDRDADNLS
jgi:hypothetical protein